MTIDIKKASIHRSLFLAYEFEQTDVDVRNNIKTKSDAPIHDDLRSAFRALIPHYAFICEEVRDEKLAHKAIKDPELYLSDRETAPDETFFRYRVQGFSLRELNGVKYLQILGSKKLDNGEEISFSTYGVELESSEYVFETELTEAIEHLKEEVLAYMQGKSAPKAQMEMFGDDEWEDTQSPL